MSDTHTQQAHRHAILGYLLYFLGVIFGITALIGAIINHLQRKNTNGTYAHSHIVWQLISFWTLFALAVAIFIVWPAATAKWLLLITGLCWTITLIIGIYYLWRKQPLPFLTHKILNREMYMTDAHIAGNSPMPVEVENGKDYYWCSCGQSSKQPFCDGSHKGTDFAPTKYTAEKDGTVYFCSCKQTSNQPLCDGSHKALPED